MCVLRMRPQVPIEIHAWRKWKTVLGCHSTECSGIMLAMMAYAVVLFLREYYSSSSSSASITVFRYIFIFSSKRWRTQAHA